MSFNTRYIIFIYSDPRYRNYTFMHVVSQPNTIKYRKSLKYWESELKRNHTFFRTHFQYLVNKNHIAGYRPPNLQDPDPTLGDGGGLIMSNLKMAKVSRACRSELKTQLKLI